jgi:hypothetical protein
MTLAANEPKVFRLYAVWWSKGVNEKKGQVEEIDRFVESCLVHVSALSDARTGQNAWE